METSARALGEPPGNQRTIDSGRPTAVTDRETAPSPQSNQPEKGAMVPMTDPFFKETVEVMKEITPAWHTEYARNHVMIV